MKSHRLKQKVKMDDIAKLAGVSKAAVSKALNNKPDISEKLRSRIFKICEDLDYQINFRIQDMIKERKTGMTHNIAFVKVGYSFSDPAYTGAIDGIAKGVEENNLRLLLGQLTGKEKSIYDLPPLLRDGRIDGFIVTGQLNSNLMKVFSKLKIPFIVLGTYDKALLKNAANIFPDLQAGMEHIITTLKSNGINKIAYFSENPDNFYEKEILHYFKASLKINNLHFNKNFFYSGTGRFSGAASAMQNVFSKRTLPFESVVCMDFRCAQDIAYLAHTHSGIFACPAVTIATTKHFLGNTLPVPTVFYDSQLAKIAYQGLEMLLASFPGK